MKVTIELDDTVVSDRAVLARILERPDASPQPTLSTEQPVKRGRKPKAAEPEVAAPESMPEPSSAFDEPPAARGFLDDDDVSPPPAEKTYAKEDVHAALVALQLKKGVAAAKQVLADVGKTERLGTLDAAKYGEVIAAANKAAE